MYASTLEKAMRYPACLRIGTPYSSSINFGIGKWRLSVIQAAWSDTCRRSQSDRPCEALECTAPALHVAYGKQTLQRQRCSHVAIRRASRRDEPRVTGPQVEFGGAWAMNVDGTVAS